MISILIVIIGLLLLTVGLVMASRTHSKTISEVGEFIAMCGCLILIGIVAFYGVSFGLRKMQ